MTLKDKVYKTLIQLIPILVMMGLIPVIRNDYWLTGIYTTIIVICFFLKYEKNEGYVFFYGLIVMTIFEIIFVSTGVETFVRNSFFGYFPLWLPILWAYSFVVIKRTSMIMGR